MANKEELENTIDVLKDTVRWFKKRIQPHDTGWMYDTIGGINYRIQEAKKEIKTLGKSKKELKHRITKKS